MNGDDPQPRGKFRCARLRDKEEEKEEVVDLELVEDDSDDDGIGEDSDESSSIPSLPSVRNTVNINYCWARFWGIFTILTVLGAAIGGGVYIGSMINDLNAKIDNQDTRIKNIEKVNNERYKGMEKVLDGMIIADTCKTGPFRDGGFERIREGVIQFFAAGKSE